MSDYEGSVAEDQHDDSPLSFEVKSISPALELSRRTILDADETPNSGNNTPHSVDESYNVLEEVCQNPEPPKELAGFIDADNIGGTVFSKHWLFTTLMNLLKVIDQQEQLSEHDAKEGIDSTTSNVSCLDIDETLQDNLCKLWDMSMNPEVVEFLMEFKAIDLLSGVIDKSRAPRATEICVGILGNMACSASVCLDISANRKLVELVLLLLQSPDAPTLVETTRLLRVCISKDKASAMHWIRAIKEMAHVFESVLFILQSSTNPDLLRSTAEFVDKLMEIDEEICIQWSTAETVLAVMEAVKQTGFSDFDIVEVFIHLLQLISTSEPGVQALVSYAGEVYTLIMRYLVHLCIDDIVAVEARENVISSSFSVLLAVFVSWEESEFYLTSDFQLLRCIVKVLEVVYPKIARAAAVMLTPRTRSKSLSISGNQNRSTEELSPRHSRKASKSSDDVPSEENENTAERSHTNGHVCDSSSKNEDDGRQEIRGRNDADESDDENTSNCSDHNNSQSSRDFTQSIIDVLYEVIQNLLIDIITTLDKIPVKTPDAGGHNKNADNGSTDEQSRSEEAPCADADLPKSLIYLNSQCDRRRLQCLLHTLDDVSDKRLVSAFYKIASRFNLDRLCRIIDDTIPSHSCFLVAPYDFPSL